MIFLFFNQIDFPCKILQDISCTEISCYLKKLQPSLLLSRLELISIENIYIYINHSPLNKLNRLEFTYFYLDVRNTALNCNFRDEIKLHYKRMSFFKYIISTYL